MIWKFKLLPPRLALSVASHMAELVKWLVLSASHALHVFTRLPFTKIWSVEHPFVVNVRRSRRLCSTCQLLTVPLLLWQLVELLMRNETDPSGKRKLVGPARGAETSVERMKNAPTLLGGPTLLGKAAPVAGGFALTLASISKSPTPNVPRSLEEREAYLPRPNVIVSAEMVAPPNSDALIASPSSRIAGSGFCVVLVDAC